MSQDYKNNRPAAARPRNDSTGGSALKGVLYGLILGFLIAAAVGWWFTRMSSPFVDKFSKPAAPAQPSQPGTPPNPNNPDGTAPTNAPANAQSSDGQPIVLPGKPGESASDKRFQFPDILSGKTDGTSPAKPADKAKDAKAPDTAKDAGKDASKDKDKDAAKNNTKAADKTDTPAGNMYLQAGAFQKESDAEAQRAALGMIGVQASVNKAVVGEKIWYRVRVGPFSKQDEANRARNELKENGVDASLIRN